MSACAEIDRWRRVVAAGYGVENPFSNKLNSSEPWGRCGKRVVIVADNLRRQPVEPFLIGCPLVSHDKPAVCRCGKWKAIESINQGLTPWHILPSQRLRWFLHNWIFQHAQAGDFNFDPVSVAKKYWRVATSTYSRRRAGKQQVTGC